MAQRKMNRSGNDKAAFATIAAGYCHSLALKADGSHWALGNNIDSLLGDGSTTNRDKPVRYQFPLCRSRSLSCGTGVDTRSDNHRETIVKGTAMRL